MPVEYAQWVSQFDEAPAPLTDAEKAEFLKTTTGEKGRVVADSCSGACRMRA